MRRMMILSVIALASALATQVSLGQDPPPQPESRLNEVEPNDDPKTATQEVRVGQEITGIFTNKSDVDCFLLCVDETVIIDLTLTIKDNINARLSFTHAINKNLYTRDGSLRALNLRVAAGKHVLRLGNETNNENVAWTLGTIVVRPGAGAEIEPNEKPDEAQDLPLGVTIKGLISHPASDRDNYVVQIPEAGIYRLTFVRKSRPEDADNPAIAPPEFGLKVEARDSKREPYGYRADEVAHNYVFFPFLEKGAALIHVQAPPDLVGAGYELTLETYAARTTPELETAARAAIKRGEDWLLAVDVKKDSHEIAARAFQLAALAEGEWHERKATRDAKVDELLAWFDKAFTKETKGTWKGEEVYSLGGMYEHAMATLALAEAVAGGFEKARPLCARAVKYLLAAQLSEERCDAWRPVDAASEQHGGWRYSGEAKDADLSVMGWCLVALYAADAAGIKEAGLSAAVRRAQPCVKRCKDKSAGFVYQPGTGGIGLIRQSIGALVYLLLGMDGAELKSALADLEMHQCAGTQSPESSHDCPFYYWYYATRAKYLQGGAAWETWRTVTMAQLTRTQLADGSWQKLRREESAGTRFSSGLAVIILRLCLNKPPSYLRKEVKGF